jgi:hypothetical protein
MYRRAPMIGTRMSTKYYLRRLVLLLAVTLTIPANAVDSGQATGAVFAASDGHGAVQLFWFPPAGTWPAGGWRIEDAGNGNVVVNHVTAASADAVQNLSEQDAQSVRGFIQSLQAATSPEQIQSAYGFMGVRALSDPQIAHALGLTWTLENVPSGRRKYRVVGIDSAGKPIVTLNSPEVDAAVATPPPPPPQRLLAQTLPHGVALFWRPAPTTRELPVIAYSAERAAAGAEPVVLTPRAIVLGAQWKPSQPAFTDTAPQLEQEITYSIHAIDLFGRPSESVSVRTFVPDLSALDPPLTITVETQGEQATVTWSPNTSPNTAGYIVERALLAGGPFEAMTTDALSADTHNFVDRQLNGGTAYFYRVRSMGPRGNLGDPSRAVKATVQNSTAPPAPGNLHIESESSVIRLTWDAVAAPLAGYVVERRSAADAPWSRLNGEVTPEPRFDDHLIPSQTSQLSYRVIAIGFDNQEGRPSGPVEVTLPDRQPPSVPHILDVSGMAGKVTLTFAPGLPVEDTKQFLVVRGGSQDDPGLVIGDPLPASTSTYEDTHVLPGNSYWYRIVAVDAAGNRSDPTRAVVVQVAHPGVSQLPAPTAEFVAKPFPHVRIVFKQPESGMTAIVQRRTGSDPSWLTITAPLIAAETIDANPPDSGQVAYRVVLRTTDGAIGSPSEPATVNIPSTSANK